MENADAVPPAHPVPRTPKTAYPGLRRCGGSRVALAFLTRLAAWQSLRTGHVGASLDFIDLASLTGSTEPNFADLGQTARPATKTEAER
ncbi:MAG: hypothetical protein JOZ17_15115 [Acetobacteraceae bacterium]|nr:hypothetical protein [Acetobacteraceae bacterium]